MYQGAGNGMQARSPPSPTEHRSPRSNGYSQLHSHPHQQLNAGAPPGSAASGQPVSYHQHHHHHHPPPPHPSQPSTAAAMPPAASHLNGNVGPQTPQSHSRDNRQATFYDPTSEARERRPAWQTSSHSPGSNHPLPSTTYSRPSSDHENRSPRSLHRTQLAGSGQNSASASTAFPEFVSSHTSPRLANGHAPMPPPNVTSSESRSRSSSNTRVADPMSFSNILSGGGPEPRRSSPEMPRKPLALPGDTERTVQTLQDQEVRAPVPPSQTTTYRDGLHANGSPVIDSKPPSLPVAAIIPTLSANITAKVSSANVRKEPRQRSVSLEKSKVNGAAPSGEHTTPPATSASASRVKKSRPVVTEKQLQAALAKIDAMTDSDFDASEFNGLRKEYEQRSLKRLLTLDVKEDERRKRRRVLYIQKHAAIFIKQAENAKERFFTANEEIARDKILAEDQAKERERKKLNQRARRHELQKNKHEKEAQDLLEKLQMEQDEVEREKLLRQVTVAEKRAQVAQTKLDNPNEPIIGRAQMLEKKQKEREQQERERQEREKEKAAAAAAKEKEERDDTPMGGVMGSFAVGEEGAEEPPKKRAKTGGRLKKSKEQKRAEIERAAQGALDRGDDISAIGRDLAPRDSLSARDATPAEKAPTAPTKAYDTLYDAIWKDIARKDIPKLTKLKDSSFATKQSNLKKTAQLASKEARRWQLKTNKSTKDTQARAKRAMREMLSYWKRNERDERDQRKMAERQELENAKKAEAEREANRQKRKLNFLISQTELYSHFIGKKVKTDDIERSTDDVSASAQTIRPGPAQHTIDLPDSLAQPGTAVTDFDQLDFDAEDETALRQAAMANAQKAVQDAQDRARAFDNEGGAFDDGEMNFQNPTSLQGTDIPQPTMLSCQLKEYQLKGLNWLVNLYEQGINGILADEMGLGKTVQSISVMAYLAEVHNIWGPFLVIAPASTLHNWQQEIVKFVPNLKALPYWGNAKDRKVLRKFWDRKHITYSKDSPFHVLITSYQLVVMDAQYFQKVKWQYMILDEAQAIKSSQSSRWKSLLGFHCRNRLLLTGTPIQNSMQELWALLHFIMPSLFDSHDEFSEWFSKDIESHAQSNTKLNEDQLRRLHMILKPFMLRRVKKHVQKELGDKVEKDVFCDLTYRQRAYYTNLRNKISLVDLIEKATVGDDQDTATLMNLVMQFRKVCNHPDLFERADTSSPASFGYFAETASFMREGHFVDVAYSVRSLIEFNVPKLITGKGGRLDIAGPENDAAGFKKKLLTTDLSIWNTHNMSLSAGFPATKKGDKAVKRSLTDRGAFSWLAFIDKSASEVSNVASNDIFMRAVHNKSRAPERASLGIFDDEEKENWPTHSILNIVSQNRNKTIAGAFQNGYLYDLMNVSRRVFMEKGYNAIEPASRPAVMSPPVEMFSATQAAQFERESTFFNVPMRRALFPIPLKVEEALVDAKISPTHYPVNNMLPAPLSEKSRYTHISVPSMRRFVTDSGKLGKLDELLAELKEGGHRVLLYFQMTRMIDLMEEYLTYRNYKYCRLDGSTKLEDRRDTVADFQQDPSIFVFLLSTRAGGLGINLTAADTVIFYDSDWNPTIDSQAMDRAHRLGQTRQVTVYRMITRGTIEERIRRRALQKEEVQRVVISGGAGGSGQIDFNTRSRENRTKDIAMWLADDDQAAEIERKEAELAEREAKDPAAAAKAAGKRKKARTGKEITMDDMYHEGEGHFDDSGKPSGAATPVVEAPAGKKRKGVSKRAKTAKEKLAIIDGMA